MLQPLQFRRYLAGFIRIAREGQTWIDEALAGQGAAHAAIATENGATVARVDALSAFGIAYITRAAANA